MGESTATRNVVVANPQGLHLRHANLLVEAAGQFESTIEINKDGERFDAKSIMAVISLGANQGTVLNIEATGSDAQQALDTLARLIEADFADEDELNQDQAGTGG